MSRLTTHPGMQLILVTSPTTLGTLRTRISIGNLASTHTRLQAAIYCNRIALALDAGTQTLRWGMTNSTTARLVTSSTIGRRAVAGTYDRTLAEVDAAVFSLTASQLLDLRRRGLREPAT